MAAGVVPHSFATATLRAVALAPPSLKTPLFHRVCAAFARQQMRDPKLLVRTNLGISSRLRCYLPLGKSPYVFGQPEHNISERSTLALVSRLSWDCAQFIDIGANEGVFTFVVSKNGNPGITIHWFEPDDELCGRLRANLALNNIGAQGNRIALSNARGTATFYKNLTDDSSGSLGAFFTGKHDTREQMVETATLSDYFLQNRIEEALVKVDVEGHGGGVWEGSRAVAGKIKYLIMEIIEPDSSAHLPARIIRETGWHAYYVRDFDLVHSRDGGFDYVEPFWNWFFCRMAPNELAYKLAKTRFRVCERG